MKRVVPFSTRDLFSSSIGHFFSEFRSVLSAPFDADAPFESAVVTAASAWLLVPEGALTSHPMASSHVPHVRPVACRVNVHVEVPSEAKVYLNDSRERPLQRGPLAQFEGVECDSHAEVTVQMPNPSGSPLPEAWMRMPLPGVELRAAADRGVPFRVAPLGDAK